GERELAARALLDGLRVARSLADIAPVYRPVGIERLEPRAGPVLAPFRAAEQAGSTDREDLAGAPAPDEDAVHVHGVVVHVLSVAHVVPVLAAVEAADHAPD